MSFQAYAAAEAGGILERFDYDPGPLGPDQVEIAVESCGLCHSDLSMWKNDWDTSPEKEEETRKLGADRFVNSRDEAQMKSLENTLDFLLVTVNVELDWSPYIAALRPNGKLHFVGAAPKVESEIFPLLAGQKSIGASPIGSPATSRRMIEFAARHGIAPRVETMPMSEINEAFRRLEEESPAHRIVLENDSE